MNRKTAMPPRKSRLPRGSPIKKKRRPKDESLRIYGPDERIAFVKSLPCVVDWCENRDIENMHICGDGTGRKANADKIIPACHAHHRYAHSKGIKTFATRFTLDLPAIAANVERQWQAISVLHTTDPLCATCGASFREEGDQCASCAYTPCDSDC